MSRLDEIRKIYHDTKKKAYGKNISISLTDSQIKTLLDMLDEAKEVLEFYGNEDNWYRLENTNSIITDLDLHRPFTYLYKGHLVGGKRARELLKKWGDEK